MQHRNRQQPTLFHVVDAKVADVRLETPPKEGVTVESTSLLVRRSPVKNHTTIQEAVYGTSIAKKSSRGNVQQKKF